MYSYFPHTEKSRAIHAPLISWWSHNKQRMFLNTRAQLNVFDKYRCGIPIGSEDVEENSFDYD